MKHFLIVFFSLFFLFSCNYSEKKQQNIVSTNNSNSNNFQKPIPNVVSKENMEENDTINPNIESVRKFNFHNYDRVFLCTNDKFYKKKGKSWKSESYDYGFNADFIGISEYDEINQDENYYYIGQKSNTENIHTTELSNTDEEAHEGINETNSLPMEENSNNTGYVDLGGGITEKKIGKITSKFKGYENIFRIPKNGGWVQEIYTPPSIESGLSTITEIQSGTLTNLDGTPVIKKLTSLQKIAQIEAKYYQTNEEFWRTIFYVSPLK